MRLVKEVGGGILAVRRGGCQEAEEPQGVGRFGRGASGALVREWRGLDWSGDGDLRSTGRRGQETCAERGVATPGVRSGPTQFDHFLPRGRLKTPFDFYTRKCKTIRENTSNCKSERSNLAGSFETNRACRHFVPKLFRTRNYELFVRQNVA